ncbi:hypothetical protein ACZ90_00215 [Streptomyces albus subsp. albus]|nr:hypothetical protein ACZ90_00215 [Streptomyces albus subsp. albus]
MTEMTPAPADQGDDWGEGQAAFPEFPANPHNHRYTLSYDPQKPPFLVVRANTATELMAAFEELENDGVYAAMGNAWRVMKAQATVGAGLGPTASVPDLPGAPVPSGLPVPQGPPFGPNVSVPAAPGYIGPPTAPVPPAPAPQGGAPATGARNGPKPRPDWPQVYRITVPPQQKDAFKQYRQQYMETFKGKVYWAGGGSYWVHGDVAQSFAPYNPVPA